MKFIIILINIITLLACNQNNNINKQKTEEMDRVYYINYNFSFPYEIFVNDVLFEKDIFTGRSGPDRLNNYLLSNGKQNIKIKVYSPLAYNGGLLKDKDLKILSEQSALYDVKNGESSSYHLIQKLDFNTITKDVPFYEQEWSFEADIPFQLEGWRNSEDLTKIDKEELLQKVYMKYNNIYDELNTGDVNQFLAEIKFSNEELFKSNYFNDNQKTEYLNNLRKSYSNFQGKLIPINIGNIIIMGNGRVVTMEVSNGKYKGAGLIIAEDKEKQNVYFNTILLHIPKEKKDFEILRINSVGTKM